MIFEVRIAPKLPRVKAKLIDIAISILEALGLVMGSLQTDSFMVKGVFLIHVCLIAIKLRGGMLMNNKIKVDMSTTKKCFARLKNHSDP